MKNSLLMKQLDEPGVDIHSTSGTGRNIVTEIPLNHNEHTTIFRLGLQEVGSNPDGVLASIRTINFTVGNIGYPNHIAAVVPEGQELLCELAKNGKAKEVAVIAKSINSQGALWKMIPLYEALIANGEAEVVRGIIKDTDFAKEDRGFFGDRYRKLLALL